MKCEEGGRLPPAAAAGGSRSCATIASVGGGRNKCDPPASISGRNKCDPPVYIFGRRGLRPSRVHLRSRRSATLPRASSVAEDCDPPACISGRRGLRPSRMHSTFSVRSVPVAQERDPPEALHLYTSPRLKPTIHCHLPTAHYPHSKTGNRRIKNNVPPLLISTPGCCTIHAIFEQRRGFGHGVRA